MKTTITTTLVLLFAIAVAQTEKPSLFEKSNHIGGFGGLSINLSEGGNYHLSGEGAWMISNFYFGGFGYSTDLGKEYATLKENQFDLVHSTGGLLVGAFSNTSNPFSIFTEAKFGFGELMARRETAPNHFEEYTDETFTVIPIIGIAFRPSDYIQLRLYGGYQFSSNVDLAGIKKDKIEGALFGIGIFFGSFNQ